MSTMRDQIVKSISELVLKIDNLEVRNLDRMDFHEVHVAQAKRALEEAFEAGKVAGKCKTEQKNSFDNMVSEIRKQIIDKNMDIATCDTFMVSFHYKELLKLEKQLAKLLKNEKK